MDHFTLNIAVLEVQNAKFSRLCGALYRSIAWYSAAGDFFSKSHCTRWFSLHKSTFLRGEGGGQDWMCQSCVFTQSGQIFRSPYQGGGQTIRGGSNLRDSTDFPARFARRKILDNLGQDLRSEGGEVWGGGGEVVWYLLIIVALVEIS